MRSFFGIFSFFIFAASASAEMPPKDFRQPLSFQFSQDLDLKTPEKFSDVLTIGLKSVNPSGKKSEIGKHPGDSPNTPVSNCVLRKENLSGIPKEVVFGSKSPLSKTWGIRVLRVEKGRNFKFFTRNFGKSRMTTDQYNEFFEFFNSSGERLDLKCRVSCTEILINGRPPDHRCGHFISGSTISLLEKLGVKNAKTLRLPVESGPTVMQTSLGSVIASPAPTTK